MVDRIKALAQAKGHTLASLERAAGISNGTISKWDEHSPTLAKLEKVAQCLDVNLIELFREESTKKAPSQMAEGQSAAKQALVQFILRMPDDQAEELLTGDAIASPVFSMLSELLAIFPFPSFGK